MTTIQRRVTEESRAIYILPYSDQRQRALSAVPLNGEHLPHTRTHPCLPCPTPTHALISACQQCSSVKGDFSDFSWRVVCLSVGVAVTVIIIIVLVFVVLVACCLSVCQCNFCCLWLLLLLLLLLLRLACEAALFRLITKTM